MDWFHENSGRPTPVRKYRKWSSSRELFREQTIIHEAVHLTHCGMEDLDTAVTIGAPECVAQFVVATNGKSLDPRFVRRCGYIDTCGRFPKDIFKRCRQTR